MNHQLNRAVIITASFVTLTFNHNNLLGQVPHYQGKVILVVDETMTEDTQVDQKIDRLIDDLSSSGWRVLRHKVERGASFTQDDDSQANWAAQNAVQVRQVKALIKADYDAAPNAVKAVFLLGHVAVPYSGDSASIAGRHAEAQGSHPSDIFYGNVTTGYGPGAWSDLIVDNSHALTDGTRNGDLGSWFGTSWQKEILNIPGDGKFDC